MAIAPFEKNPTEPADPPQEETDPGVAARQRALEEGSGWSSHSARIAADPDPQLSGTQDPPRWPRPLLAPRRQTPPRRAPDGDSGLDPHWNVRPVKMTPQEAVSHQRGVGLVRAAIAAANTAVSKPNTVVKPWLAPMKVASDLRELQESLYAGFLPASHREKRAALTYLPLLNPNREGPSGIPAYLKNLSSMIGGRKDPEAAIKVRQSKLNEAARYLDDAKASQKLFAELPKIFEDAGACGTFRSLLEGLPQEKANDTAQVVARYFCLDEIVRTGKASIGADPLRTKESSSGDTATSVLGEYNNPKVKRYIEEMFAGLSIADMQALLPFMHRQQTNRMQFWNRILQETGEDGRKIALGILNKYAV